MPDVMGGMAAHKRKNQTRRAREDHPSLRPYPQGSTEACPQAETRNRPNGEPAAVTGWWPERCSNRAGALG